MVCNWKLICRHSQTLGSGYFTLAAAFEFLITAYHLEPGLLNAVTSSNGDLMTKKANMHHKLAFPYCNCFMFTYYNICTFILQQHPDAIKYKLFDIVTNIYSKSNDCQQ